MQKCGGGLHAGYMQLKILYGYKVKLLKKSLYGYKLSYKYKSAVKKYLTNEGERVILFKKQRRFGCIQGVSFLFMENKAFQERKYWSFSALKFLDRRS